MQSDHVLPGVAAQHRRGSGIGSKEAEQNANGRRLARTVRAEESVYLAAGDAEIELVQRPEPPERLAQAANIDHVLRAHRTHLSSAPLPLWSQ
jgi:hypothetical protein